MLFSNDSKSNNTLAKKPTMARTVLRTAFNPEIGANVRPLRETIEVFVNLLAMIFISQGMFPADHPDYVGVSGRRLTLSTVLGTVWGNLRFSKETVPQCLMFFVLIFGLGFAAFALVMAAFALLGTVFVSKAHAQSYFAPYGGGDDIATQWIDFLFNTGGAGFSFTGLFANDPLAAASGIEGSLRVALGYYSDAILVVAAVVLFYHLAAMTVETAHHGVVMGKEANQIWAPIRLVVAIGLLVPIGGQLNSGQYIVIQITQWGTGLASNVWALFVGEVITNTQGLSGIPPYAREAVYNTMLNSACDLAYDKYNSGGNGSVKQNWSDADNASKVHQGNAGQINTGQSGTTNVEPLDVGRCGNHAVNQTMSGGKEQSASTTQGFVKDKAQSCFDQMQQNVGQYTTQHVPDFVDGDAGGNMPQRPKDYDGGLEQKVADYMDCLTRGLPLSNLDAVFAASINEGWLSAGAALSAIAQAQADVNDLSEMVPQTHAPNFSEQGGDPTMKKAAKTTTDFKQYLDTTPSSSADSSGDSVGGSDACAANRVNLMQQASGLAQAGNAEDHYLDRILQVIDWFASWNCVWNSSGSNYVMGIEFTGPNPLAEMAQLGHAMINTAYNTFDVYVNMSASSSDFAKQQAEYSTKPKGAVASLGPQGNQGAVTAIGGILLMITSTFFTTGILLAYYVPLIPFITYLFGVLTWVVSVLEAVVCVPLIALAHLNPKGDGLPGPSAKVAYFFVFNIFLRPVLMVFGLIFGLLVFYAAVSYMNTFYMMAVGSGGGLASGHMLLSRLVYSGLYVIILYMAANSAFKTINWIPEHAIKWLGQQSMHFHHMGDAQQVVGPLMQGAGNISQVTSSMQQGGWGAATALKGQGGFMHTVGAAQKLSHGGGGGSGSHGGGSGGGSSGAAGPKGADGKDGEHGAQGDRAPQLPPPPPADKK